MSNAYYNNATNTILDGTTADAGDVELKCDDIAAGFDVVAADLDNCIRFTNADFTAQTSNASASGRADKLVGFDGSGNLELKTGLAASVAAAQAAQTAAETAQGLAETAQAAAETAQGLAEAAQAAAETAEAHAETAEANAETAQAAAEAARDLAQSYAASANLAWSIKATNYTAVSGDRLVGDTSGGAFTITLPASPSTGDRVSIKSTKDATTYNLTIGRNGANINGTAADLVVDVNYFEATLVYIGATIGWSM